MQTSVSGVIEMLVFLPLLIEFTLYLVATAQQCSDGDIVMMNGTITMDRDTYYMAGSLQICINRMWATVCQREWDDLDAAIACRQLGLVYTGSELSLYLHFCSNF